MIFQLTAPSGARLLTGNASFLPDIVSRPSAGQAPRQTGDDPRTDHDQARFNPPRSPTRESARHRPGTRLSGRRGHIFWNLDRGDEAFSWSGIVVLSCGWGSCGMHAVACMPWHVCAFCFFLYFVSLPLLSGFRPCPHWPTRCALGCFGHAVFRHGRDHTEHLAKVPTEQEVPFYRHHRNRDCTRGQRGTLLLHHGLRFCGTSLLRRKSDNQKTTELTGESIATVNTERLWFARRVDTSLHSIVRFCADNLMSLHADAVLLGDTTTSMHLVGSR